MSPAGCCNARGPEFGPLEQNHVSGERKRDQVVCARLADHDGNGAGMQTVRW